MKSLNYRAPILRPSPKQKILYLLLLSTFFNGLMLLFRLYKTEALGMTYDWHVSKVTDSPWVFMFLVWNLFLAWIPFLITYNLKHIHSLYGKLLTLPMLLLWLLFLPNAPYIITDLIHLRVRPPLPLWYDTTMLFAFAWTGMMLGFFSLLYARDYWARYIHKKTSGSICICLFGDV